MKFIVFTILSVQFVSIKYIHIILQPSPPSSSRTFSSSQTETLVSPSPRLWAATILLSVSMQNLCFRNTVILILNLSYFSPNFLPFGPKIVVLGIYNSSCWGKVAKVMCLCLCIYIGISVSFFNKQKLKLKFFSGYNLTDSNYVSI